MTWRAVHPSLTKEVRVPEDDPNAPTFTIGFWPPLEAERAKLYISKLRRQQPTDQTDSAEDLLRRARVDLQAFRDMARFGVRGWTGLGDLGHTLESIEIDGRTHTALAQESCDVLYHSGLLLQVALACWKFNNLTDEEKKTSASPSSSHTSKNGTHASAVTLPSQPARNGGESSVSMADPSQGARTS